MPSLPNINTIIKNEWHPLLKKDGDVWILMNEPFEKRLTEFLNKFETGRKKDKPDLLRPSDYPKLPFGKHQIDTFEWKFRRGSLAIVNKLVNGKKNQLILEIGSWNSWLTNRLAEKGHTVVALDYFIDERDGLKTKKNYTNNWIALQTDICNPDFFSVKFDIIILNHCLQYFPDPIKYSEDLKSLLKKEGEVIIVGLSLYKNPLNKKRKVEEFRQNSVKDHGISFFNPTKAYLDFEDKKKLEKLGFIFYHNYNKMHFRNIYSRLNFSKPVYSYAIFSYF